jgi:hypothetical protein
MVSNALTCHKARFSGGIAIYIAFLIWSWAMMILNGPETAIGIFFAMGLGGTCLGGLGFYLWLVTPKRSE